MKHPISMAIPVGEGDAQFGDFVEDPNAQSPVSVSADSSLKTFAEGILGALTPREAKVLRMRFGIGMHSSHTLEEVGRQFNVTRERIRQIEAKALYKLSHDVRVEDLHKLL